MNKKQQSPNTTRSDDLLQNWGSKPAALGRATLAPERTFDASPEDIFPLLCPTREYDWIPGWQCELLHSRSGLAEHNAVFRTLIHGEKEVWVCTRYEPSREVHYLRIASTHLTKLEITLVEVAKGRTRVNWALTASALVEEQNHGVEERMAAEGRLPILEHLFDDLAHYLETGGMRGG